MSIILHLREDGSFFREGQEVSPEREADERLHREVGKPESRTVMAFDLMVQFIERCIEDSRDAKCFRHAAVRIATGCRGARV